MLKVVIADDEKKICRLIEMICDWDNLGMEIVGVAYNGIETLKIVEEKNPDILIMDIRMPGYDGIEVVKILREKNISTEVIIVSGYTEFEYAHAAIQYGVNSYLLKPIKKVELENTLLKVKKRCLQKEKNKQQEFQLEKYKNEEHIRRRTEFIKEYLCLIDKEIPDIYEINSKYLFKFESGLFRVVSLQLHYDFAKYNPAFIQKVMSNYVDVIKNSLKHICFDMEYYVENDRCYVICNYDKKNQEEYNEKMNDLAKELSAKRFLVWGINFSIGLGKEVYEIEELSESWNTACIALREVLIHGCEKVLEMPQSKRQNNDYQIIDWVNEQCERFIEYGSEERIEECIEYFKENLLDTKDMSGDRIFNIVRSIGTYAIIQNYKSNNNTEITKFINECQLCSTIDEIMLTLKRKLFDILRMVKEENTKGEKRPIREAKNYIMDHYSEQITLDEVAANVGFSSGYLSSMLKKEIGMGFVDYLIKVRMDAAKKLLRTTKIDIKDICLKVGYHDLKHFNSTFRKYTGLKPGEYRKLYGN